MRILLIIPTFQYTIQYPCFMSNSDFPVGFAYLASALKDAGHEVFGLNPNNDSSYSSAYEMLQDRVNRELDKCRPDLIGIGGLCTDFQFLRDTLGLIRLKTPATPVVCGGGIINNDAEFTFRTLHPDFCIIGEGEEIIVQLANMIEQGSMLFEHICNLGYWLDGQPRFTRQDFTYPDLDSRSFPDYTPFDIDFMLDECSLASRYLYRYTRPEPRPMTIVAARNCPFNCSFCVHNRGMKYRARSIENILKEIKSLYEQYRFNILIILDELFATDKQRLKKFCDALLDAKKNFGWDFDWLFQTHANAALDTESLTMAKAAGCYYFSYGIESASPRVLESMNKKTHPDQIVEAIKLADEVGIGFGGNFIFGDISENAETIAQTLEFASRYCLDIHIFFGDLKAYPGSKLFEHCTSAGKLPDKLTFYENIDRYIYNMTSMSNETWKSILDRIMALTLFPFVKTCPVLSIDIEVSASKLNPMLGHNKSIWKVMTVCPHCGSEVIYREIIDDVPAGNQGISIITGCSHCNKRIRITASQENIQVLKALSIKSEQISCSDISANKRIRSISMKKNILFISLEFPTWQSARSWSYAAHLGLEEGFSANGIEYLTIPALAHTAPEDRSSWLSRAAGLCEGKKFDQVWIEMVHTNLDEQFLSWLETVAPIRIGLVGESLQYRPEAYVEAPHLKERRARVEKRLSYMTHALTVDECDADDLNAGGVVKALWWVSAVPERFIRESHGQARTNAAIFCGAVYGKRSAWLEHPSVRDLLVRQTPLEDKTPYPGYFDELHKSAGAYLAGNNPVDIERLAAFMAPVRHIRQKCFGLWIEGLQQGNAVVNLPSFLQGYAGRVFEGMAAGRPALSWDIPNRPRTSALFEEGKEILLFPENNPEILAQHILRLQADPGFGSEISANARRKLWRFHTCEKRISQILDWIETGREPVYDDVEQQPVLDNLLETFTSAFAPVAAPDSPAARPAASAGESRSDDDLLSRVNQANEALAGKDVARAVAILTEALRVHPTAAEIRPILESLRAVLSSGVQSETDAYYSRLFSEDPIWSSPNPNTDEQARWTLISRFLERIVPGQSAHGSQPMRILDLGCGRGWLTRLASAYGNVEGVEPVAQVAELAKRLFPDLHFQAGTSRTILGQTGFSPYDVVISSEVIEHVPGNLQSGFVADIGRLLGNNGHVIITTPRAEVFEQWMEFTNYSRQPVDDWLTEEELDRMFSDAGFRNLERQRIYVNLSNWDYILQPSESEPASERILPLYQVCLFAH